MKMISLLVFVLASCAVGMTAAVAGTAGVTPVQLMCDYRVDPLGIDSAAPQLGWVLKANDPVTRGLVQSACQILVASSAELLDKDQGDLWDSGKVDSGGTPQIAYAGKPLRSDESGWWKVRVWDGNGEASDWSAAAHWQMGVLDPADWQAKWITAPASLKASDNGTSIFRNELMVKPGLKRATVNICGLGQYEMKINGAGITQDVLTPGWTQYNKTCLYDTYDVTAVMHEGANAIGVVLGNGMYRVSKGRYTKFQHSFGQPQMIAHIHLEYQDGSKETLGTDEHWRAGVSPMTFSSVYGGEDWDARLEQKGWDQPGFDESKWQAAEISPGPGGALRGVSRSAPPIRTFEVHQSISQKEVKPNVTIYDLGQEASHVTRFTAHGPAGSMIRITPSELLKADGSLFKNNYNGKAWSQYTLAGTGEETYTSKFYYMGDRYLQVECVPAETGGDIPHVDSIEGVVVHSSIATTGEFSCSNDLFNRIYAMIHWAEVSNMMSVITDCPHRERLGWLEQDYLHGPSFWYSYDMRPLFTKIVGDITDCQMEDGLVPSLVPEFMVLGGKWRDATEWGSSSVLIPWQQYEFTGDLDSLRQNYPLMKRYVEHLSSLAKNGIVAKGLGDWIGTRMSKDTPLDLVDTAIYYEDVQVMAKSAKLLGKQDEGTAAEELGRKIRDAFNEKFFHAETNQYGPGSQGSNAMALDTGLVAPVNRQAVVNNLVADLEQHKQTMTVGEVCLPYMLRALAGAGRSDVIYAINNQSETPGYGYQLKKGATALCETWEAAPDNSQNQFMLGHIMEWFYHDLAGIQLDEEKPGFSHIIIHPAVTGELTEVKASYNCVRGKIVSEWKRDGRKFTLHITIPPNTTAFIQVPAIDQASITEGGKPADTAPGVKFTAISASYAGYEIGSGDYVFESKLP